MSTPSFDHAALEALIARFAGRRVAVLGDCMLDRYLWGRVERISPEAPVPVVEVERESSTLGGAGNVVSNLVAMGVTRVRAFGVLGSDPFGREMLRLVPIHHVRAELVLGELAHRAAQNLMLVRQPEIHGENPAELYHSDPVGRVRRTRPTAVGGGPAARSASAPSP